MINTVLFDLDGTLLPMNAEIFTKNYFKAICNKCKHMIEPKKFMESIMLSTEYMIKNKDSSKTNMELFMEDFKTRIPVNLEVILPVLEDFYIHEFRDIETGAEPNSIIQDIVEKLKNKGYHMVVATNPLFPRQAILHRIQWAGLNFEDFLMITDYEAMHFCKPNIEYYQEILTIIEKKPKECLMVGNDVQEDLIASELGIKTFLVTEHMIHRDCSEPRADHIGNYMELYKFVNELPNLKKE